MFLHPLHKCTLNRNLIEGGLWGREEIRRSPEFRAQFHTMCANIGVDPLASNKGAWAQLLGFGDFYSELGVQVIEACLATRWGMKVLMKVVNDEKRSQHGHGSQEWGDHVPTDKGLRSCIWINVVHKSKPTPWHLRTHEKARLAMACMDCNPLQEP